MLTTDLLDRLQKRAADPKARTDAPDPEPTEFFSGAFKTVRIGLDGKPPPAPGPLPPPATAADFQAAEKRIGLALPEDLKQLYAQVADGGFGPGDGLAPLADMVERYRKLVASPPGESGQTWPENLLPINLTEPGADCYDLKSGQIILWDEESLADGPDDRTWQRSFRPQAESLSGWLEDWLARPPAAEEAAHTMEKVLLDGLRQHLANLRAMTPQERAEMGLPEEGWEEEMFGHLGVDLKTL